ncbi:MAG: hypothetical protein M1546_15430 [Chloroflexi bacterium]|nr:hypothetical protein [Chloroflexota bacterium]
MRIRLDGAWDFVADLDPKYHAIYGGFHRPDINRRHWKQVAVPGVWQKYEERYDIFEGVCWFAREFDLAELPAGATAQLRFGAVNYQCNVYVNGQWAGSHEGGYTAFTLDCTAVLKPGLNHIAVQVDNRATSIKWPPCLGYFNYGGIHRSVFLEICCGSALDDLRLQAVPAEIGGELTVSGSVRNMRPGLLLRVRSADGLSWEDTIGADGAIHTCVPFPGVDPWSPARPHLEPVTVELLDAARIVLDAQDFQCGFRALEMSNGRIHLNGAPLALKGICYVYDSPASGLVMTPEQVETDLQLMKAMGCNAVRCHYPMDETFYAAADRLGLLVWIEPPIYCYHPGDRETNTRFADPAWLALAQQMAREMIAVARNHPSVAIYGIGNECNTHNPEAEPFFRALAGAIRAEDPTRLLSYAALYGIVGPIVDIVDVLGINSYWGWYDQIDAGQPIEIDEQGAAVDRRPMDLAPMRRMLDEVLARNQNLALLLTEFGADAVPGFHSRSCDLWSEDYHAGLLRAIFALAADYPQIVGTFPFCFSDYRDPSKIQNGYWDECNLKGVVDIARRRKLAFAAIQQAYIFPTAISP